MASNLAAALGRSPQPQPYPKLERLVREHHDQSRLARLDADAVTGNPATRARQFRRSRLSGTTDLTAPTGAPHTHA